MDMEKIFNKDACPTKIGGQAVLEGVMMQGQDVIAIAVRKPDGEIKIKKEPRKSNQKYKKIPLLRGVVALGSSMTTGVKALTYSAEVLEESGVEVEKGKFDAWIEKKLGDKANDFLVYFSVAFAIVAAVFLFMLLPTFLTSLLKKVSENAVFLNLAEGVIRILFFIAYVFAISRLEDIKRVFQYHGAEHKTIHCYESDLELTVENARDFTTLHPRCGTSFLMIVMVISLLIFSFLGWPNPLMRVVSRVVLLPFIAGISYEIIRWAGKSNSALIKAISYPGLLLQKLTTREPDDQQLEVAIASMNAVLEGRGDDAEDID